MIGFLIKGVVRDRNRSLLPIIVVALGVAMTVFMYCWLTGIMGESITMNANFATGHLKVTTHAYAEEENLFPNDCAIIGTDSLMQSLSQRFPYVEWVPRIRFGGLADFPNSEGETRAQGPVVGWGIDLLSPHSQEVQRFNMIEAIENGRLPQQPGEALIAHDFAQRLQVRVGDVFTLFSTNMDGGMAFKNFTVVGTVRFGVQALDRGAVFVDVADVQLALGMTDATGEIVGYFTSGDYDNELANSVAASFGNGTAPTNDVYTPVMRTMRQQGTMAEYMDYASTLGFIMVTVFVMAMAVVLWNTGLLGGLRRYNEFGIRLAMGEEKRHIYLSLIGEAFIIGMCGSVLGTIVGLGVSYYLQEVGLSIGDAMQNATVMMPSTVRATITPFAFYIGFLPGVVSMVLGNALSGLGIYKRQTATLFKELEV
jgi:putative ABC transport system permease protein